LTAQNRDLDTRNDQLQRRTTELEDDLTAARTSLRRMIRNTNQPGSELPS
jgi:hypothetical protein